jgi:hypothetical protein
MIPAEADVTTILVVFPFVTFTNIEGKEFMIRRERILHSETYCRKDEDGREVLDPDKTFVNFVSPNHKSKGSLHAVIDMPLKIFRDHVVRPAYEEDCRNTTR